jgi:hypothetical protein
MEKVKENAHRAAVLSRFGTFDDNQLRRAEPVDLARKDSASLDGGRENK